LNNVGRTIIGRRDLKSLCKQCFPLVHFAASILAVLCFSAPTHPSLLRRDCAYLPVGRQTLDDFAYSIPKQRLHAALNGCVEHVGGSGP
jgi:hypothetical protein